MNNAETIQSVKQTLNRPSLKQSNHQHKHEHHHHATRGRKRTRDSKNDKFEKSETKRRRTRSVKQNYVCFRCQTPGDHPAAHLIYDCPLRLEDEYKSWTTNEVFDWISVLDGGVLSEVAEALKLENVRGKILSDLVEDDLVAMKIKLGDRKQFMIHLHRLQLQQLRAKALQSLKQNRLRKQRTLTAESSSNMNTNANANANRNQSKERTRASSNANEQRNDVVDAAKETKQLHDGQDSIKTNGVIKKETNDVDEVDDAEDTN